MSGLVIEVVETDPDYIGLEVRATTERYAAATFIYGQPSELLTVAAGVSGFAAAPNEDVSLELGTLDASLASGFCGLALHALDGLGHIEVRVHVHECALRFDDSRAALQFRSELGALDRFASALRQLAVQRSGIAALGSSD